MINAICSLSKDEKHTYEGVSHVLDYRDPCGYTLFGAMYAIAEQAILMPMSKDIATKMFIEAYDRVKADMEKQR